MKSPPVALLGEGHVSIKSLRRSMSNEASQLKLKRARASVSVNMTTANMEDDGSSAPTGASIVSYAGEQLCFKVLKKAPSKLKLPNNTGVSSGSRLNEADITICLHYGNHEGNLTSAWA